MMKYLKSFLIISIALITFSSCKNLNIAPTDRFTNLDFWTTSENVNNALNNVYGGMYNSSLYFNNTAMSDNAYSSPDVIASGSYDASYQGFLNVWSFHYAGINSCNLFLSNVDQNKTLPAAVIARMKGEVRFIRAWHYFNLMKWWGAVPLIIKPITPGQAKVMPRTSQDSVFNFIINELQAASTVLPSKDQYTAADKGRITNGAAMALEARVLLYQGGNMQKVADICDTLMNDQSVYGHYSLAADYDALFSDADVNKDNPETMLTLQYVPGVRTWSEDFDFAPISAGSRTNGMAPTQELVNSYLMLNGKPITDPTSGYDANNPYSNRDPRLTATVVYDKYVWTNPDGTTQIIYIKPGSDPNPAHLNEYDPTGEHTLTGYYWRKYFDPNHLAGFSSGLNLQMIRYAEVLLDYAEAKNDLGEMDENIWNNTIRLIRQRAGFTNAGALDYPGSNADMVEIIRRERRDEFAMEGLRVDDIRRWKIADSVLNGYAHGARFGDPTIDNGYLRVQSREFNPSRNYLWPIPASEIALDPNLIQNPGY